VNVAVLKGRLSRPAAERVLPSGDRIINLEVSVQEDGRPTDTVPVAWFDAPPSAAGLDVGAEVVIVGRVRRRFFKASGSTQSRTEVVAETVVPAGHAKRVAAAVRKAHDRLASLSPTS
jgi:single-strand DNA-binding protein